MKKRFLAFWDIICFGLLSIVCLSIEQYIIIEIKGATEWYNIPFHYTLIAATGIAIPPTLFGLTQRLTIDFNVGKLEAYYLVNYKANVFDIEQNWELPLSEIENVTVVKLTKEGKRKYTSTKFLFSKYLKIQMKYGHCKYVYISHYSNFQIKKIIRLLTGREV